MPDHDDPHDDCSHWFERGKLMCECPLCTYKEELGNITCNALNAGVHPDEVMGVLVNVNRRIAASIQADENRTGCEVLH